MASLNREGPFFLLMKSRKMKYQIKTAYLGKVKLENGNGSFPLDENTPQGVLAQLYDTVLGKEFIEPVAAPVAETQTK